MKEVYDRAPRGLVEAIYGIIIGGGSVEMHRGESAVINMSCSKGDSSLVN